MVAMDTLLPCASANIIFINFLIDVTVCKDLLLHYWNGGIILPLLALLWVFANLSEAVLIVKPELLSQPELLIIVNSTGHIGY